MIAYGLCIGTESKYQSFARPGLARCASPAAPIAESRDNTSIFTAYNEILDTFAGEPDLEALVLLHDDLELVDERFEEAVRECFADTDVAVAGVTGGRNISSLAWWEGERVGACWWNHGRLDFGARSGAVDTVDGMLLALSPWAVRNLRFDAPRFTGFHAYDADLCFQARDAGKVVRVIEAETFHHTNGGYGDEQTYLRNDALFREKWASAFTTPSNSTQR